LQVLQLYTGLSTSNLGCARLAGYLAQATPTKSCLLGNPLPAPYYYTTILEFFIFYYIPIL